MSGTLAAAMGVALLLQSGTEARLEAARAGFGAARDQERQAAARTLLRDLEPGDVDAALAALATWPPTASLLLRETLAGSGRARATLLERATRAAPAPPPPSECGALARALLVESFVARAAATAPFRAEPEPGGEPGWPLLERGAWFVQPAEQHSGWSWFEIDDALDREGLLERALVPTSDCADRLVAAPVARRIPVEGWLGVAAERASLRCVPLAVGAWLLPKERAEKVALDQEARGDRVTARALEREARLFETELAALARAADVRRGATAADLLRRLGLEVGDDPVGGGAPREVAFATGVALARAARGERPVPRLEAADAVDPVVAAFLRIARSRSAAAPPAVDRGEAPAAPPPVEESARLLLDGRGGDRRDPAGLGERPAAEVRAIVARLLEVARGRTGAAAELRAALVALVDAIAGRCADDPLLGGQLVELLRHEAGAAGTAGDVKAVLENGARELWALDRGTRPPVRLVLLPAGAVR